MAYPIYLKVLRRIRNTLNEQVTHFGFLPSFLLYKGLEVFIWRPDLVTGRNITEEP